MNYTLNQLQIFLKVTQTLSVTKAAEELHLTQPAVSIQLKNLQDQFDIPLTEVVGRRIYITDFGKEIAQAAEDILQQVAAINYKTQAHKGQLTGRLKLSTVSTGMSVMPFFLSPFMKQHKSLELIMDVTNRGKAIESLEQNTVDFSLISILPGAPVVEKDMRHWLCTSRGSNSLDRSIDFVTHRWGVTTRHLWRGGPVLATATRK